MRSRNPYLAGQLLRHLRVEQGEAGFSRGCERAFAKWNFQHAIRDVLELTRDEVRC
jgi:hypothetical protein